MSSHVLFRIMGILASGLLIAGCSPQANEGDKKGDLRSSDARTVLSAEDARKALIEMVELSHEDVLEYGLPYLRTDEVVSVSPSQIDIGRWHIDLGKRTFVLSLVSEAGLYEVSGVFEQDPDGKWSAKIVGKKQT
jgi:hypothetical protein